MSAACSYGTFRSGLLHEEHLPCLLVEPRRQTIEIQSAGKRPAVEAHLVCSGPLGTVHEGCDPLAEGVVHIKKHRCPGRQVIAYDRGWIEGVRVILFERVFPRQVPS